MTYTQIILEEAKQRALGNNKRADELQRLRWEMAMGMVVNSENTKDKQRSA